MIIIFKKKILEANLPLNTWNPFNLRHKKKDKFLSKKIKILLQNMKYKTNWRMNNNNNNKSLKMEVSIN